MPRTSGPFEQHLRLLLITMATLSSIGCQDFAEPAQLRAVDLQGTWRGSDALSFGGVALFVDSMRMTLYTAGQHVSGTGTRWFSLASGEGLPTSVEVRLDGTFGTAQAALARWAPSDSVGSADSVWLAKSGADLVGQIGDASVNRILMHTIRFARVH